MQTFWWRGIDAHGGIHKGTSVALGQEQIALQLQEKGIALLACRPARRAWFEATLMRQQAMSKKQLVLLLYHVGTLVQRGVPLSLALETFAQYAPSRHLAQLVLAARQQIAQGVSCAQAFGDVGLVTDRFFVQLMSIGQQAESLGSVLCALAAFVQTNMTMATTLRQALYVPALTVLCALVVLALVVAWVVPSCSALLQSSGQPLPRSTQLLLALASLQGAMIVALGIAAPLLIYAGIKRFARDSKLEQKLAWLCLRIPVFGRLVQVTQLQWWTAACGLGLRVGMPLVVAFQSSLGTLRNAALHHAFVCALQDMQRGADVATALARHDCFDGHLLAILATGHQADQFTQSLAYVEQELAREAEQLRAIVSASIQPLVIILLGVVIGFMLIAVYVPLFSMARLVGP